MNEQLILQGALAAPREVNGIEMGVLEDGTPYLTGRALSRLCGVAISTIIDQKNEWAGGRRDGKFAKLLASTGYSEDELAIGIGMDGGKRFDAYTERVVMAFVEYYALDVGRPEALANYRTLARAGFRLFVYTQLGYDPAKSVPLQWREFHDRLALHNTPSGYFSVFKEMSDFVLAAIRNGLRVDHKTIPDISVGQAWSKYWADNKLEEKYGARAKHPHHYPDYFPQAESNPQPMNVYPVDALGDFRRWMDRTYIPEKFPNYLAGKVNKGMLPASTAELLLTAVQPVGQLAGGSDT
jgi:hypothetical protein